jgi:hypothetical protein
MNTVAAKRPYPNRFRLSKFYTVRPNRVESAFRATPYSPQVVKPAVSWVIYTEPAKIRRPRRTSLFIAMATSKIYILAPRAPSFAQPDSHP